MNVAARVKRNQVCMVESIAEESTIYSFRSAILFGIRQAEMIQSEDEKAISHVRADCITHGFSLEKVSKRVNHIEFEQ